MAKCCSIHCIMVPEECWYIKCFIFICNKHTLFTQRCNICLRTFPYAVYNEETSIFSCLRFQNSNKACTLYFRNSCGWYVIWLCHLLIHLGNWINELHQITWFHVANIVLPTLPYLSFYSFLEWPAFQPVIWSADVLVDGWEPFRRTHNKLKLTHARRMHRIFLHASRVISRINNMLTIIQLRWNPC